MLDVLLALIVVILLARGVRRRRRDEHLPRLLASAEAAGIITGAQRERLLAHAAGEPGGRRLGAAWLAVVAGLFIVAGVSLLIARNWEAIGAGVRLSAFLLALLAAGEAAIRGRERAVAVALPLELLWFLLPLLGIGLYAQTFQLSGDPVLPYLLWLALTAPLAWGSARPVVAVAHTTAMAAVLFAGNFFGELFDVFGGGAPGGTLLALTGETPTVTAWVLSLILLAAIAAQSLVLLPRHHRHHFVAVLALWVFALLLGCEPLRLHDAAWLAVAAVALATASLAMQAGMDASLAEWRTSASVWLGVTWALTFLWHATSAERGEATVGGIVLALLAAAAAVGAVARLAPARLSPSRAWARTAKTALLLPLAASALLLTGAVQAWWAVALLMNLFLVAVAIGIMWHGALAHESAQINLGVVVLVGLLLTRFLDVFGGMLQTGVGFIVAGVVFAALAWALERTRRRLVRLPAGGAS